MLKGAHVIVYSTDAQADAAFMRDVLGFAHVDLGHNWLIFRLPPTELAVHPSSGDGSHELFFMCDDVKAFVLEMQKKNVPCTSVEEQRWGSLVHVTLPGGSKLGVYQPKHASPP